MILRVSQDWMISQNMFAIFNCSWVLAKILFHVLKCTEYFKFFHARELLKNFRRPPSSYSNDLSNQVEQKFQATKWLKISQVEKNKNIETSGFDRLLCPSFFRDVLFLRQSSYMRFVFNFWEWGDFLPERLRQKHFRIENVWRIDERLLSK